MSAPLAETRGPEGGLEQPGARSRAKQSRRRLVAIGVIAVLAAAVAAAGFAVGSHSAGASPDTTGTTVRTSTVPVVRRLLVDSERVDGTLQYADSTTVDSRL